MSAPAFALVGLLAAAAAGADAENLASVERSLCADKDLKIARNFLYRADRLRARLKETEPAALERLTLCARAVLDAHYGVEPAPAPAGVPAADPAEEETGSSLDALYDGRTPGRGDPPAPNASAPASPAPAAAPSPVSGTAVTVPGMENERDPGLRAQLLFNAGRYAQSADAFDEALRSGDAHFEDYHRLMLGVSLARLGQKEEALKTFKGVCRDKKVCSWRGDAALYTGLLTGCGGGTPHLKRALKTARPPDPGKADWLRAHAHAAIGRCEESSGDRDAARVSYRAAAAFPGTQGAAFAASRLEQLKKDSSD